MKPAARRIVWSVACVALTAGVIAPKMMRQSSAVPAAPTAPASTPADPRGDPAGGNVLAVSTFVVKAAPFAEKLHATGTLRADEAVELQAETTGKIVSINFTEGARVRAGALLVKLNDADLRATLARAACDIARARAWRAGRRRSA